MLTSVDRLLFVRGVPIFKELRDDFLVRLASIMDELSFPGSHTIFTEGQEGRALYIVVSGRVSVHLRGQELAQLDKGTCFGEMSLFDAEPRSASVTTVETCDCLMLTQQQLYEAIDETPGIAVNIIRLLSRRIRELNNDLNEKQQELKDLTRQAGLAYAPDPHPTMAENRPQAAMEAPSYAHGDTHDGFPYSSFPY
ncbi:MAG: Crp/Fnr family transcriptional regulator [Cyanobacteria bacterium J06638_28]